MEQALLRETPGGPDPLDHSDGEDDLQRPGRPGARHGQQARQQDRECGERHHARMQQVCGEQQQGEQRQ